jgi:hypothetical protein
MYVERSNILGGGADKDSFSREVGGCGMRERESSVDTWCASSSHFE